MTLAAQYATRIGRMKASEIRELLKLLDQPGLLSFAGGIPDPALFPAQAFADAFQAALSPEHQAQSLQYSVSEGYLPLRHWIAAHMAKIGVQCEPQNILITSGSQQAIDYLGKLFLSPKDTALVGWPTYLGALAAFNAYEPRYDRLRSGENQPPERYAQAAEAAGGRVKFAYLSPDFANPTGVTMTHAERLQMLDLAETLDTAVIEDAAYRDLRYYGDDIPSLLAADEDGDTVIHTNSFSKSFSPGLRVGWGVLPPELVNPISNQQGNINFGSPHFSQQVMIAILQQGSFEKHVEAIRTEYRKKLQAMLQAAEAYLGDLQNVSWLPATGGLYVWMCVAGIDTGAEGPLFRRALDMGVLYVPGCHCFPKEGAPIQHDRIRLSFGVQSAERIVQGMQSLAQAVHEVLDKQPLTLPADA